MLINQASRGLYLRNQAAFKRLDSDLNRQLLTSFYAATDPTNVDARVASAMSNPLNPASLAAGAAGMAYQLRGLQSGVIGAAGAAGVFARPFSGIGVGGADLLSAAERTRAFGTADNAIINRRTTAEAQLFTATGAELGNRLIQNIGSFGGLKGNDIGTVLQGLARTGGLGKEVRTSVDELLRNMKDSGDKIPADQLSTAARGIADKIQKVSQTVAGMRDVFGGTLAQQMEQLSGVMGIDALATLADRPQMAMRAREMRHLALMTGTSAASLGGLGAAAQSYIQAVGGNMGGATAAVNQTMAIMGAGGVNLSGINREQFQSSVLRNVVGAQQGTFAKYVGAAFEYWRAKTPGMAGLSDAEAVAQFQLARQNNLRGGMETQQTLARLAGASVADLAIGAQSDSVGRLLSETNLGQETFLEQEKQFSRISKKALEVGLTEGGFKPADVQRLSSLTDFTPEAIKQALTGMDPKEAVRARHILERGRDIASRERYGMSGMQADQYRIGRKEADRLQGIAAERAALDVQLAGVNLEGGVTGLLSSLQGSKPGGTQLTFQDLFAKLLGMQSTDVLTGPEFGAQYKQLSSDQKKQADAAVKALIGGRNIVGEALSPEALKAFSAMAKGENFQANLAIISKETDLGLYQENYLRTKLKDVGAADEFMKQLGPEGDAKERSRILETAFFKKSLAESGIVGYKDDKITEIMEDRQITPEEFTSLNIHDTKTQDAIRSSMEAQRGAAGLPTTNLSMENVLQQLVETLKTLSAAMAQVRLTPNK